MNWRKTTLWGSWVVALAGCEVSALGLDDDVMVNPEPQPEGGGSGGSRPTNGGANGSAGEGGDPGERGGGTGGARTGGTGGASPSPDAGAIDAGGGKPTMDAMKPMDALCVDPDRDGRCAGADNCPNAYNPAQENSDDDLRGDACQGRLELFLDAEADRHTCGGSNSWADPVSGIAGTLLGGFPRQGCNEDGGWVSNPHALDFSGSGDTLRVDIAQNAALNGETFTAEVWARVTGGDGSYRSPLTSRAIAFSPERRMGWNLYAGDNDRWQAWMGGAMGNAARWFIVDGGAVNMNRWTHLAMTFDGGTMRFYVDGNMQAQQAIQGFLPNRTRPTRIGSGATEGDGGFDFAGQVAKVVIFSDAQPATLIRARFENDRKRFGR